MQPSRSCPSESTSTRNLFIIPDNGKYILYAPLAGKLMLLNARCAEQIQAYWKSGDQTLVDPAIREQIGGFDWMENQADGLVQTISPQTGYAPVAATIFLTNTCNLHCRYCYARAGDFVPKFIPFSVARGAVDLVLENAREKKVTPHIGFHGGGEPTAAFPLMKRIVEYTLERYDGKDRIGFGLATNGVMGLECAEFVARHASPVTLSFDGPPDIQNYQRPKADGSGSFEDIMGFIDILKEHGTPFVIRSTITDINVERLSELVEFFSEIAPGALLHFEPAFARGRCLDDPSQIPLARRFATRFIEALDTAEKLGVWVRYSAARIRGAFSSFCGCAQDAFSITHDGYITGCYEVCDKASHLSDIFHFGNWDAASQSFNIDQARLNRLRELTVQNKTICSDCFAKWNCSGDCPVKFVSGEALYDYQRPSVRCEMNQKITRHLLRMALDKKKCRFI